MTDIVVAEPGDNWRPNSAWEQRIRELSLQKGYTICAARNRQLTPCTNKAGKGTDHVGEGRCKNHGGGAQNVLAKNFKHGRYSQIKTEHPQLQAKIEELSVDHEVFDLEGEIIKLRALAEIMVAQGEPQDLLAAGKIWVDVSKVVERLHNIQVGRKYYISIENVSNIMEVVKEAIFRHVPDEYTRHKIAQELNSTRLSARAPRPINTEYEEVD